LYSPKSVKNSYIIAVLVVALISSGFLNGIVPNVSTPPAFAEKFIANLSGAQEVPPVATTATGKATFRQAINDTLLRYKVNITGFPDATAAHIQMGNAEVIVDLLEGSKRKYSDRLSLKGNISKASLIGPMQNKTLADLIYVIINGNAYVNIHTETNPDGETRGQIQPS
jgi:CHRD domain